jgi:hypothetical protein
MALACERHGACMAMVGEERPALRPLSDCRTLPLEAFTAGLGQVVRGAGEAGLVQLGNVSTDGTQSQGKASRHQAMSDGYMKQDVDRLREASAALVTQAYGQDEAEEAV